MLSHLFIYVQNSNKIKVMSDKFYKAKLKVEDRYK